MLNEDEFLGFARALDERVSLAAQQNGDDYDLTSDMEDYIRLNEPALALEFMAERVNNYNVDLTISEFDDIETYRNRLGLPLSNRFIALRNLIDHDK
ncbi:hypothetical protein [Deinococcus aquatilis]|uniref:hypothetical protein n=1 Tax=Deinococcus aquatilis TaxID=519440 RepID=UPI000374DD9C|nr:hypothetical protein [Deinococcus aquatilis]